MLFKKVFPNIPYYFFLLRLKRSLKGCESVLDIGCGKNSPLSLLKFTHTTGIEGYRPNYMLANKNKTHNQLIYDDVRNIGKLSFRKIFDASIALDLIEHLTKKEGLELLKNIHKLTKKKIVIFTPNGILHQAGSGKNLEKHQSGWKSNDFKNLGFKVYGLYGLKNLRNNEYGIRFKPKLLWGFVSLLTDIYTYKHPESAKALLCVKDIN